MISKKNIALLIVMHISLLCFSQAQIQSRDVKRELGHTYLLSNGYQYQIRETVVLAQLKVGKKQLRNDIKVLNSHSFGMLEIAVPDSIKIEEYVRELDKSDLFEYVEFDTYLMPCMSVNDTYFANQWGISHIYADAAWNITTGSPSVKVAVIDSDGFDLSHPDLYYGSDTYSNLSVSEGVDYFPSTDTTSTYVHGTMLAGIISAKTNNGIGIAGIAGGNYSEGAKIIPYHAKSVSNVISAIYDAVSKGVKVINMSFILSESGLLNQALSYAYNNGVNLVCSSGKEGNPFVPYPASHAKTIAVGAINSSDEKVSFSDYGTGLDLVAPGVSIKSTVPVNCGYYDNESGTSFAAPHVSGVIALMLSINPSLTPSKINEILRNTAIKINPDIYSYSNGWNEFVGYGLVDAYTAVSIAGANISGPTIPEAPSVYSVTNLPTGSSVAWSYSGNALTTATMTVNSPAQNQCTINNSNKQYIKGILTAIVSRNGSVLDTLTKVIDTGVNFSGKYSQDSYYYTDLNWHYYGKSPTTFHSGDHFSLYKGPDITLTSNKFTGANISYLNGSVYGWSHNNNTVSFYFPYYANNPNSPAATTITGTNPNNYEVFQFSILGKKPIGIVHPIDKGGFSLTSTGRTYVISIGSGEMDSYIADDSWTLSVVNAITGLSKISATVSGSSYAFDTTGWESGVYVIQATVGSQTFTQKFSVK